MEFNRSFDNDPATGGTNPRPRRHEFSRLTGSLTVGEASHAAEQRPTSPVVRAPESVIAAALGGKPEEAPGTQERHSEWHTYKVDEKGQVVDQRASMGQAFLRELQPEQMMTGAAQQDDDDTAATQPTIPVSSRTFTPQAQPLMASPGTGASATPGRQSASILPGTSSVTPNSVVAGPDVQVSTAPQPGQIPVFGATVPVVPSTPPMQSRRFSPSATSDEPLLAPGTSTHVDDQHLLPAPKNKLVQFFTSAWFWLFFGLFLIFYFTVLH